MDTTGYLPLATATGLQRSLDITANNLANASTAGFRAERLVFESLLNDSGSPEVPEQAFGYDSFSYSETRSGTLTTTGNPLDTAIQGDGWFAYETGDGQIAYGRDGRFVLDADGLLQTTAGRPVLDAGGGQIVIDPAAGAPAIGRDGTVSDNQGNNLGQIGVFAADDISLWMRIGESMFVPRDGAPAPLELIENPVIIQGALEGSNVNPVTEMVRMIEIQRSFEQMNKVSTNHDQLRSTTLSRLGQKA